MSRWGCQKNGENILYGKIDKNNAPKWGFKVQHLSIDQKFFAFVHEFSANFTCC